MLCPRLLLVCKYCESDVPASDMSEHESLCGDLEEQCRTCGEWVQLREWEKHQTHRHGLQVQKSPNRQRRKQSIHGEIKRRLWTQEGPRGGQVSENDVVT